MQTKKQKRQYFDQIAPGRDKWKSRNRYYHDDLTKLISFLVPPEASVLDIGCNTGDLIADLQYSRGVGIDFSTEMIRLAKRKYPKDKYPRLDFIVDDAEDLKLNETFDYVILSDVIGDLTDIWTTFRNLKKVTKPDSRIIITCYNALWEPILKLGEKLHMKVPQGFQNWLSLPDVKNLLNLNGFEVIQIGHRLLFPKKIPLLSEICNRFLARLPLFKKMCLVVYLVARPTPKPTHIRDYSVSVIVPCRNEKGNIRAAVDRLPELGSHTELIFVDGNSNDGTVKEIEKVIEEHKGSKDIKLIHQIPPGSKDGEDHGKMLKLGKGDAVRKGFAAANEDILMILDADLTVPPEELYKFYLALAENNGEFVNGTRLVYPMEKEAMRFLNKLGNKFFSALFTWLLGQRIKDTLCGTKVLFKKDYTKIATGREYFGNFDPFGDFDLLFGAAKQNLKIVEVPVHYRERIYGNIKIERFKHGLILLKMSWLAMKKFKFRKG